MSDMVSQLQRQNDDQSKRITDLEKITSRHEHELHGRSGSNGLTGRTKALETDMNEMKHTIVKEMRKQMYITIVTISGLLGILMYITEML